MISFIYIFWIPLGSRAPSLIAEQVYISHFDNYLVGIIRNNRSKLLWCSCSYSLPWTVRIAGLLMFFSEFFFPTLLILYISVSLSSLCTLLLIIRHPPIVCISKAALLKRIGNKEGGNEKGTRSSSIRREWCIAFHVRLSLYGVLSAIRRARAASRVFRTSVSRSTSTHPENHRVEAWTHLLDDVLRMYYSETSPL